MKLIIAIIASHKLEDVVQELDQAKIYRKTVTNVLGVGEQRTEVYRGTQETGNLEKKIKIEIAVNDEAVESTIQAILKGARGDRGDGKIFVLNIEDCVSIERNIRGRDACGQ